MTLTLPDPTAALAPDVFLPPFAVGPSEPHTIARARLEAFKLELAAYEALLALAEAGEGA